MSSFRRTAFLALTACGAAVMLHTGSYAADYLPNGTANSASIAAHRSGAYGYRSLQDDDSDNSSTPDLPSYEQNKGSETGGPARMDIPE